MGRAIIHEDGRFFEWSTVVDAPTTTAMPRAEMAAYITQRYGRELSPADVEARLDRAERNGTSALGGWLSKESIAEYNRAGPDETHLPWPEIMALVEMPMRP